MKKVIYTVLISLLSLNLIFGQEPLENRASNQLGTLPGNVSVNPDGSATYNIPIKTLPGRAGVEPGISLVYNSMRSNSAMGLGWSISGLQAISRGGTDLYFETEIDGVDFDDNDKFYLNGQRLIEIAPNEYKTEQDGYTKIVANGTAGNGPQSFTVIDIDGTELQFGQTTYSRIEASGRTDVMFWKLNRIIDIRGNYIDYEYEEIGDLGLILSIKYTGNIVTGEPTFNSIDFVYIERDDETTFFTYGSSIEQNKLLSKIETRFNGQIENTYQLNYTYGMLGEAEGLYPKLTSVQPIYKDGSRLNETQFEWGEQTESFEITNMQNIMQEDDFVMGDFNGDGKSDIIWYRRDINFRVDWQVFYADNDGSTFVAGELFTNDLRILLYFQIGDYNGDGLDDIGLVYNDLVKVMFSNGQSFGDVTPAFHYINNHEYQDHHIISVDLNGNGKDEILLAKYNLETNRSLSFKSNLRAVEYNGQNWLSIIDDDNDPEIGFDIFHTAESNMISIADLNGNGKTNIIWNINSTNTHKLFEFENGTLVELENFDNSFLNRENMQFADFNGDGISDCFVINSVSVDVHIFNGLNDWIVGPTVIAPGDPSELFYEYYDREFSLGDFNGDGKQDIILTFRERYAPPPEQGETEFIGAHIMTYYNNGSGFTYEASFYSELEYDFYTPYGASYYDFNGDGKLDMLLDYSDQLRKILFLHKNEKSDLIHKFTNGLGHETGVEYDYLTNNSVYEKGSEAIYPIIDIQPPMAVAVKSLTQNGIGGFFESNYAYKKATTHVKGRGMLGFGEFIATNNTANTISETKFEIYDQDANGNPKYFFPYPIETSLYSTSTNDRDLDIKNKLLQKTVMTMDVIPVSNDDFAYQPIVTQTISSQWDNNETNSHIRTTVNTQNKADIDQYGNSTKTITKVFPTTDISGTAEMISESNVNYVYDTENHILNRPKEQTKKVSTPDNSDYTFYTLFDYYDIGETGSNGIIGWPMIKSIKTRPDSDELYDNTIWFDYDQYGNITKKTVSAFDLSGEAPYQTIERVTEYEYSLSNNYLSRFPTKSTVNEGPGYETNYTYEPERGLVNTVTNTSGLQTQFVYDDFGRMRLSIYPDGNYTSSYLYWVTTSHIDAPLGSVYYSSSKTNGSSVTRVFYDKLGRPMRSAGEGMTTRQKIFVDQIYNERGLTDRVSVPFFAENPPDEHDDTKWTSYSYDRIGRVFFTETPTNSFNTSYDGLSVSVKDNGTGITKSSKTNNLGQTILVNDPSGDISYTYYSSGLLHTTDALGQVSSISYDAMGNKSGFMEPNTGIYTYKHGAFGELLEQTDFRGNITTMEYDGLGRAINKAVNGDVTQYLYNQVPGTNGFGLLNQILGHNAINYSYDYDAFNRPISETKLIDGDNYITSMEYDAYGRLQTYTYPSDYKIDYLYTIETGMFYKIEDNQTGNMLYETNEINQRGQLLNYSLGNNLITSKSYNSISGSIESIQTDEIQNLAYTWDQGTGNLLTRTDNTQSIGLGLVETFGYDNLLEARLADWQVNGQQKYLAGYKDNGNITFKSDITSPVEDAMLYGTPIDKPNAIQSVALPTYDYLGHASQKHQISYTGFNKVEYILQTDKTPGGPIYNLDIFYGPDNLRRKTELSGLFGEIVETKYFVSSNYEIEIDNDGNQRQLHYLSASDGTFAIYEWESMPMQEPVKKMYYIHKDHLGSYETISDEDGLIVEKLSFDPWGRRRNPDTWSYDNTPTNHLFDRGFTGHEHLDIFGLVNMNGRVYDAWVGSFLSPDPILSLPGNSQNYNRYSYALNNPLKYIDPSGYDPIESGDDDDSNGPGNYASDGLMPSHAPFGNNRGSIGNILPGSGNHWTDNLFRTEFGDFMMRSRAYYSNKYGTDAKYGGYYYSYGKYYNMYTGFQASWGQVKGNYISKYSVTVPRHEWLLYIVDYNLRYGNSVYFLDFSYKQFTSRGIVSSPQQNNMIAFVGGGDLDPYYIGEINKRSALDVKWYEYQIKLHFGAPDDQALRDFNEEWVKPIFTAINPIVSGWNNFQKVKTGSDMYGKKVSLNQQRFALFSITISLSGVSPMLFGIEDDVMNYIILPVVDYFVE